MYTHLYCRLGYKKHKQGAAPLLCQGHPCGVDTSVKDWVAVDVYQDRCVHSCISPDTYHTTLWL